MAKSAAAGKTALGLGSNHPRLRPLRRSRHLLAVEGIVAEAVRGEGVRNPRYLIGISLLLAVKDCQFFVVAGSNAPSVKAVLCLCGFYTFQQQREGFGPMLGTFQTFYGFKVLRVVAPSTYPGLPGIGSLLSDLFPGLAKCALCGSRLSLDGSRRLGVGRGRVPVPRPLQPGSEDDLAQETRGAGGPQRGEGGRGDRGLALSILFYATSIQ